VRAGGSYVRLGLDAAGCDGVDDELDEPILHLERLLAGSEELVVLVDRSHDGGARGLRVELVDAAVAVEELGDARLEAVELRERVLA
jgi:hypothetical protein